MTRSHSADHFYRHLERTLDLSFVRELVPESYAGKGWPSINPVVFFKLQLVMFFTEACYCVKSISLLKKAKKLS